MKKWTVDSLVRILSAVDLSMLREALNKMGLLKKERDENIEQAKQINDFLISLIPMPGATLLGDLLQEGLDWLTDQSNDNETLDLESCKNSCNDILEEIRDTQ